MKKIKFSKRTKIIGVASAVLTGATVINIVKDQVDEIGELNNVIDNLHNKLFDDLNYELRLESFIATSCGEDILRILTS